VLVAWQRSLAFDHPGEQVPLLAIDVHAIEPGIGHTDGRYHSPDARPSGR